MATTTTNFNLTKPADTDPVDIVTLEGDNMDKIDTALQDNKTPTFSDYNSSESGMPSESQALTNIKSKATLSTLFQNIKAYLKKACTVGQLVTNCTSSSNTLPLAASQGKVLQDQITTLNRNFGDLYVSAGENNFKSITELLNHNQSYTNAKLLHIDYRSPCAPDRKSADGILLRDYAIVIATDHTIYTCKSDSQTWS